MKTQNPKTQSNQETPRTLFMEKYKEKGTQTKDNSPWDFPGGAVVKNPPANAGDTGSSPGPGRSHMLRSN